MKLRFTGPPPLRDGWLICHECKEVMRPKLMREEFPNWEDDKIIETVTLVGFTSPEGHNHDDNCWKRPYVCPSGHEVTIARRRTCHRCNWAGKPDCGCHDYDKVSEWPLHVLNPEGVCA